MLINSCQIKSIDATKVTENQNKNFVSQDEKTTWNSKASIKDTSAETNTTWSSNKINQELDKKVNLSDNYSLVYDETEEVLKIVFK